MVETAETAAWWRRGVRLLPPRFSQSWEIYASLLFLGFFVLGVPAGKPWDAVLAATALAVFLVLFFWAYWLSGTRVLLPAAGIVAIGLALLPANGGASAFLSYAVAICCLQLSPSWSVPVSLGILASFLIAARFAGYDANYLAINVLVIVAVAAIYIQVRRSESVTARLRLREEELAFVHKRAERRRIAHDLHDHLGSALSLIAVKAELARRLGGEGIAGVRGELADIADTARATLSDVRQVIADYRATAFDGELQRATVLLRSNGLTVDIDVASALGVDAKCENMLAMILCEAATNVARHARAKTCRIKTEPRPGGFRLVIADDGCGARDYDGLGVRGMRERAIQIGAAFSIVRTNGTVVTIDVPFEPSVRPAAADAPA